MLPHTIHPWHAELVIYLGKCGLVVKGCGQSTGPEVRKTHVAKATPSATWGSHFLVQHLHTFALVFFMH